MRRNLTLVGLAAGMMAAVVVALLAASIILDSDEDAARTGGTGLPAIEAVALPPEARNTLDLIDAGGPLPYEQDGAVFQNREGRLPERPAGYYHEFTVPTPGEDDRGARRIVTGENGEAFYTDDHYGSFREIVGTSP